MSRIEIHADDFGESIHASEDILTCIKAGALDSISILSNMSCFEKCVEMYREAETDFPISPKLSVHLNFMEGKCLSEPKQLPDLVDCEGHFCISWMRLFARSYLPGKNDLKRQLKAEMELQIGAVRRAFPGMKKLRIDSHQHTHMIPVVAEALFEAIEENEWKVEYIRNSREPIGPFLRAVSLYGTFQPVNFVKNLILNYCALLMETRMKRLGCKPMFLWGLIMSGHMDEARVRKLLPAMKKAAERKERELEILFHPGQVKKSEISPEFSQPEAIAFHISDNRRVEKEAVMSLGRQYDPDIV
ncbi:MAG: ChbG/HpnK family deacetylase [Eubacteriales bacterium]|nr:ChbG/HpnK family deacetylase [Eubacteriales bacterium]